MNPNVFYKSLIDHEITFFTGIPDSLLKDFTDSVSSYTDNGNHIISSNEGTAIGTAIGYHLATRRTPCVYLQNSGIGNALNPILSLADNEIYSIPMLIVLGWRGKPETKDEPQHIKQGAVMIPLLEAIGLDYQIIEDKTNEFECVRRASSKLKETNSPYVLLVSPNSFESFEKVSGDISGQLCTREEAIKCILSSIGKEDIVVSTTGKASRELFELEQNTSGNYWRNFLAVGGMGHASSIALGIALHKRNKKVYCIDGDGSVIMHMGAMVINGSMDLIDNFVHIVINNGAHESVGGQPTVGRKINLTKIAQGCGYTECYSASSLKELKRAITLISKLRGRLFVEINVRQGSRGDLSRPKSSLKKYKMALQNFLSNETSCI